MLHLLSAEDLRAALPMGDAVEAMKRAFAALSSGEADMPQRVAVQVPAVNGLALFKPAGLAAGLGAKIVTVFPQNPDRGKPLIAGLVILLDPETGEPAALLDGTFLTAWRTGAASGAATDLLARRDARTAAILGSGVQARTQALAIDAVRELDEIRVYSPTRDHLERFEDEMTPQLSSRLRLAASPADAVRDADVVCAATTSSQPVFDGRDLKPGCHVNGVGSYTAEMREVDAETVRRSRVFVDHRPAARAEAGDLIQAAADGVTRADAWIELGEVVAGARRGRRDASEITFFKSVGVAVQDIEAGAVALARAREMGLGRMVEF